MPPAAAILAAGALGAGASIYGSNKQAKAGERALASQQNMFERMSGMVSPFINAGRDMLPTLMNLLRPGANQTDTLSQMPGFQFKQDWGRRAVENMASKTGFGGNALRAGADYAGGIASDMFFPMIQSIQSLVNTGAQSAQGLLTGAQGFGNSMAGLMTGIGGAQAGGMMGAANAIGGSLTGLTNYNLLKSLMSTGGLEGGMYGAGSALRSAIGGRSVGGT